MLRDGDTDMQSDESPKNPWEYVAVLGTKSPSSVMWRDIDDGLQLVRLAWPDKVKTVQCLSWTFHSDEMEATTSCMDLQGVSIFREFQ